MSKTIFMLFLLFFLGSYGSSAQEMATSTATSTTTSTYKEIPDDLKLVITRIPVKYDLKAITILVVENEIVLDAVIYDDKDVVISREAIHIKPSNFNDIVTDNFLALIEAEVVKSILAQP